jgi:hypothetical protein
VVLYETHLPEIRLTYIYNLNTGTMKRLERMSILFVGNNPNELAIVNKSVSSFSRGILKATILFDLKKLTQSIKKLNPAGVFIDDRYNLGDIRKAISKLHGNKSTSHIPITILKSSNYLNYPKLEADDFILRSNLTGSSIYNSVINGKRFRKSRVYFRKLYRNQKGKFVELKDRVNELIQTNYSRKNVISAGSVSSNKIK